MGTGDKRVIVRNVICNVLNTGVEAVTGFVLAPFLIRGLGDTGYGLWIVLGSFAGYFGLFDLGIRSSISRYIAFHHAKDDQTGINQVLSTAILYLSIAGLVALIGLLALIPFLDQIFKIPPEQTNDAQWALGIVAVNLALSFIVNAFDANLVGCQRFDLLSAVDIPASLCRLGFTVWLVSASHHLVTLALINLAVTASVGLAKGFLSWYQNRALRIGIHSVSHTVARDLFGFGVWSFLFSVSRTARGQISPVLIGMFLGIALTTPYSVAYRLVNQVLVVLVAFTGILTPLATRLHAQDQVLPQQRLFKLGGRWCMTLTLFLSGGLVMLGKPLITLWVGPDLAFAADVLTILILGEAVPNSQYVTCGIIFAKAQQKILACLGVIETIAVAGLTIWLVQWYGLIGAAIAVALPGTLCRGIPQIIQGCYLTGVSLPGYLFDAYVGPLVFGSLPIIALAAAVMLKVPDSWPTLILYSLAYTLAFAVCIIPLVGFDSLSRLFKFRAVPATPPLPLSAAEDA